MSTVSPVDQDDFSRGGRPKRVGLLFVSAHLRAGPFRALKMRPVRQVLLLARHASENASAAAGGCPQSVESAVLRAFEDASCTREGCFRYRISLPYPRSLFFTPNASENASRTPGSLFEHGTHIPYHMWPSPVPNARHRGRLPPQRSLTNILVGLLRATGLAAVSINPLLALAVGVSCNGAQQGVHITYK